MHEIFHELRNCETNCITQTIELFEILFISLICNSKRSNCETTFYVFKITIVKKKSPVLCKV